MIPFFQYNTIPVGPIVIQVWGLWVALGITAAVTLMYFLAKKYLLSTEAVVDMAMWILVAAFIGARFFHVVFYYPEYYVSHPLEIVKVWKGGLSSLGGFMGAAFGIWLFAKKRNFGWKELLPYFDITALGLWLGWAIGRQGCFFIHDHPGRLTHFFLGVKFPTGARHDLGLYESLVALVIFITFFFLHQKLIKIRWGLVTLYSVLCYAVARFFLDFLRATDLPESDVRYAHLTPAQWGMLAIIIALTSLLIFGTVKRQNKATS